MKIKYKYGVHREMDTYPTEEDSLFEICSFLYTRKKMNEEWSNNMIKHAFSSKLNEQQIDEILSDLVAKGFLSVKNKSEKKKNYQLLKHPFIDSFKNE